MNITPLPYIKVFTNKEGEIETLCKLNNAPKLECELLASFLSNHKNIPVKNLSLVNSNGTESITQVLTEDEEYDRTLELYTSPINVEFRLYKDYEGRYSCKMPKEIHSEVIKMAIMRKAEKALDDAINRLS
tara:strand:- start:480 stop:872 length:393 start_codon:yes stop_codon:yes gene_type:complete